MKNQDTRKFTSKKIYTLLIKQ
uniref:Uncharacterized protein n=1 Tax=Anguilla anguilla TaxID=7936 RepID=A0A0E9U2C1_ANGAN